MERRTVWFIKVAATISKIMLTQNRIVFTLSMFLLMALVRVFWYKTSFTIDYEPIHFSTIAMLSLLA